MSQEFTLSYKHEMFKNFEQLLIKKSFLIRNNFEEITTGDKLKSYKRIMIFFE